VNIVLGVSPFVVFFVLMRLAGPAAGLIAAFAVSLLLFLRMLWRGESVKALEVGSLALFGVLTAYTALAAPTWTVATVRLAVDGGLLAIVLISLAIGRPFTLQYAREQVPQQFWASPIFIRTNRLLTAVWAVAFALFVAADAAAEYLPAVPIWLDIVVSVAALLGALWFSRWYPARVRRSVARVGAATRSRGLNDEVERSAHHSDRAALGAPTILPPRPDLADVQCADVERCIAGRCVGRTLPLPLPRRDPAPSALQRTPRPAAGTDSRRDSVEKVTKASMIAVTRLPAMRSAARRAEC
jgi:hypothetical protein